MIEPVGNNLLAFNMKKYQNGGIMKKVSKSY